MSTIEGWLQKKQNRFMGMWQKRWFVMNDQQITYYKDPEHAAMGMDADRQVALLSVHDDGKKGYFHFLTAADGAATHRELPVYCESEEEKLRWVAIVNSALQKGPVTILRATMQHAQVRKARRAVCAEDMDVGMDIAAMPKEEKDEQTRRFIRTAIGHCPTFMAMQPKQVEMMIDVMTVKQATEGEELSKAGQPESTFYLLQSGTCSVGPSRVEPGGFFNASNLLNPGSATETATVSSATATLYCLERAAYRHIIIVSTQDRKKMYEGVLQKVDLLSDVPAVFHTELADNLEPVYYTPGETIMKHGEKGDYFYLLVEGEVSVVDDSGAELARRGTGDYFGEAALVNDAPRNATVIAVGAVEAARLHREEFIALVGMSHVDGKFRRYDADGKEMCMTHTSGARLAHPASDSTAEVLPQLPAKSVRQEIAEEDCKIECFDKGATLGMGAFGRVFLVRYKKTNKYYAMKTMAKANVLMQHQQEHVKQEKENFVLCANPFIVNVHSTFQDARMLYMIMDFEPGGELFSIIQKAGALTPKQAQTIAATLALVFEFCHNQHIIYRDLKPENILIDSMGHAKLTDFGLSKRMAVGEGRTFTLAGTPDYMAPEVIQNTGHGRAADWWTLGILVYEMLTGVPAFYKPGSFDAEATFRRIVTGKIQPRPGITAPARKLITGLLQKKTAKRLGNLSGGAEDVKRAAFFAEGDQGGVDWQALVDRTMDGPFKPSLSSAHDTAMFDDYSTVAEDHPSSVSEADQECFQHW